jgi:hypothetical protein
MVDVASRRAAPSPLAGEGGRAQRGRMRGIERSEMAPWRTQRFQKYVATNSLIIPLNLQSHLAPLDPAHPSLLRNDTFPLEGGRE